MSRGSMRGFGMRPDVPLARHAGVYVVEAVGPRVIGAGRIVATLGDPPDSVTIGGDRRVGDVVAVEFTPTRAVLSVRAPTPSEALLARRAAIAGRGA